MTKKNVLDAEDAKKLIDRIGPHISKYDMTYSPVFPKNRKDVAAVRRLAEDGHSFGYDTIYLVWKNMSGRINYEKLIDSRNTKDYISIDSVKTKGNQITVNVSSGGSYSGKAWERAITIKI